MSQFRSFFAPQPLPDTFFNRAYADLTGAPIADAAGPPQAPDPSSDQGADAAPAAASSEQPQSVPFYHVPAETLSDADPEAYRPGDQVVENIFAGTPRGQAKGVTFHAFPGEQAGGTEHDGDHFHLRKGSEAGPRIHSQTLEPLTPRDAQLFKGDYKKAIDSLSPDEQLYVKHAVPEIFNQGKVSPELKQSLRDGTVRQFLARRAVRAIRIPPTEYPLPLRGEE